MRKHSWLSRTSIHLLIIIAMAVAGYSNSLHNDFLMDDHVDLFSPEGVAYKSLSTIFIDPQANIYRPFSHFICFLAYKAFGADPFFYHVANLILFAAICLLFYAIAYRLTGNRAWSFLTGILFCLHPINSMLVNYISAIQICAYIIATQLAFLFLLMWIQRGEKGAYYALSLIFYLGCLSSHEMSYFFPVIAACAMHFLYNMPIKRMIAKSAPYFAMAAGYFIFRMLAFQIHSEYEGPSHILPHLGVYLSTYMELIAWYLSKLLVPIDILFLWAAKLDYRILHYGKVNYLAIELDSYRAILWQYAALAALILAPLYLIFFRWKKGLKPFLMAVFMIGMLTVGYAGFVYFPTTRPLIEPHWFYFTSIGFFMLLAHALLEAKKRLPAFAWGLIVIVIFSGYGASLRAHNAKWSSQEAYCRYWISLNTHNMTPYYWLTKTLMARGDYLEAARLIESAMKGVYTLDERLSADLGYAYIKLGLMDEGYGNLQYSAKMGGVDYAPLHYYFGEYFLLKKDFKSAALAYTMAMELDPHKAEYRDKLDYAKRGQIPSAD